MDNFRDSYFQVDWDLTSKRLRGTYWGKQYDTGRGFAVTVINGGQVVAPTTEVLRLKWEKPDNSTGYVNATIVNGKFIVENIDQMFTVHGSVRADFELSVAGESLASITFYVKVEKAVAVDAIESSSQFTALQDAVGSVDSLQQEISDLKTNKRDKSVKITTDDLDTSSDNNKIKLINLSEEVQNSMAGTAPVISTVEDKSITSEKYADKSIEENALNIPLPYEVYFNNTINVSTTDGVPNQRTVSINFEGIGSLYALRKNGGVVKNLVSPPSFELSHNEILLWDLDANNLIKTTFSSSINTTNAILIAHVHNGIIKSGVFANRFVYGEKFIDESDVKFTVNPSVFFNGSPTWKENGTGVDIHFGGISVPRLYYVPSVGIGRQQIDIDETYTIPHNNVLFWDLDSGTLVNQEHRYKRPTNNILLALVHNGKIKDGYFKDHKVIEYEGIEQKREESVPETSLKRTKIIDDLSVGQGITVVGEEILLCNQSPDDHSTFGTISRYDKNTFEFIANISHNLGHLNSADYNPVNDCMLFSNASGDVTLKTTLNIIPNAKNVFKQSTIDYFQVDKTTIDFFDVRGDIGTQGNPCWGEDNNEMNNLIYISSNAHKNIYKIVLGMGANDLSVVNGEDDLTNWGEFISGRTENEFNATAKIVKSYEGLGGYGVNQGMCFHDGGIIAPVGYDDVKALKFQLMENGTIKPIEAYTANLYDEQAVDIHTEPEGVAILDGIYLVQGFRGDKKGIALSPLYNKQAGKGETGTTITLPFKCNSIPNIQITPTTDITDLYISQKDNLSFTVLSSSGGSGTFDWQCNIS